MTSEDSVVASAAGKVDGTSAVHAVSEGTYERGTDPTPEEKKGLIAAFDKFVSDELFRRRLGVFVGVVGSLTIGAVVWRADKWLTVETIPLGDLGDTQFRARLALLAVKTFGHAAVSIAIAYFGYQLLRAAERPMLPRSLLAGGDPVQTIKAILGIEEPSRAAARILKEAAELARSVSGGEK